MRVIKVKNFRFLGPCSGIMETATPTHTLESWQRTVAEVYGKITCKHTREIHPFQLYEIT